MNPHIVPQLGRAAGPPVRNTVPPLLGLRGASPPPAHIHPPTGRPPSKSPPKPLSTPSHPQPTIHSQLEPPLIPEPPSISTKKNHLSPPRSPSSPTHHRPPDDPDERIPPPPKKGGGTPCWCKCFSTRRQRVTGYTLIALPPGATSGPPPILIGCTGMQVRLPDTAQGSARDTHTHTP